MVMLVPQATTWIAPPPSRGEQNGHLTSLGRCAQLPRAIAGGRVEDPRTRVGLGSVATTPCRPRRQNRRRWPTCAIPRSLRSSAVRCGSTSAEMSRSAKSWAYCSRPICRSRPRRSCQSPGRCRFGGAGGEGAPGPGFRAGAGEGNRTLVCSLGSCRSTIELHPRGGGSRCLPQRGQAAQSGDPLASGCVNRLYARYRSGDLRCLAPSIPT